MVQAMNDVIQYKEGFKYQLQKPYHTQVPIFPEEYVVTKDKFISLSVSGDLIIKAWYAWDGPSGPAMDTPSAMTGSLGHDALYQLLRANLLDEKWRAAADSWYKRCCSVNGMWRIRVAYQFDALRLFASGAAKPGNAKKVLTAPAKFVSLK